MEFFERAHIVKNKQPKKEIKSDETMKKQLKQMLQGYKQCDNDLIRKSENIQNCDDSSSVSGFSDLNLTNSSNEDTTTHTSLHSAFDSSTYGVEEISLSNTSSMQSPGCRKNSKEQEHDRSETSEDRSINHDVDLCDDESFNSIEQILANDDEYTRSLSPVIEESSSLDMTEENIAATSDLLDTSTEYESEDSETFDADGVLASKILEKLGKKLTDKDNKKRKLSDLKNNHTDASKHKRHRKKQLNANLDYLNPFVSEDANSLISSDESSDKHDVKWDIETFDVRSKHKKKQGLCLNTNNQDPVFSEDDNSVISNDDNSSVIDSLKSSPPFVSVTAHETSNQRLSEIIGDYKYSTVENSPSDSQNFILQTEYSEIFNTEPMDVEIYMAESSNDSLVPIVGEDPTLEDIDLDITNADESTQVPIDESTSLYDNTLQSEQTYEEEVDISTDNIDTTIINPVKVHYGKNCCIFVLKHPTEIFIHGKVKIKTLGGTIEVFGYTMKEEFCEIYAPNYNYAQSLKTLESQNAYYGLFGKLTSSGLSVSEAEEIVTTLGDNDGVIMLQPLKSKKIEFVESNFTVSDLFSKSSKNVDNCFKKASNILGCSIYLTRPWKCFEENTSWKRVINCGFKNASRGIVCGGKGTGKSTFLRYYVNRLLALGPVLVVDLDPGQCEFTVAGSVAATVVTTPLLGPNFTHLKTPEKMLNIGMINTMDNPRRYAAALKSLIAFCNTNQQFQGIPWIINTMGMCNSLGLKFMALIVLLTQPTFLMQIDSKNAKKKFETHLNSENIRKLYLENYQHDPLFRDVTYPDYLDYSFFVVDHGNSSGNKSIAAKDERYLNFLAYFGEMSNAHIGMGLLRITPYEVQLRDLSIGLNVKISEDAVTKVINGKIIGLCQQTTHDNRHKMFTLTDKPLLCHGHGLVRGIDSEKGVLYVITPTAPERLSLVDTLVYADWTPELRGQERYLPAGTAVPYRTAAAYHHRQLIHTPRRRFNPLQLLKMTRSS